MTRLPAMASQRQSARMGCLQPTALREATVVRLSSQPWPAVASRRLGVTRAAAASSGSVELVGAVGSLVRRPALVVMPGLALAPILRELQLPLKFCRLKDTCSEWLNRAEGEPGGCP